LIQVGAFRKASSTKAATPSANAVRQIARAKDEIVEPWLADLNEKFFVVENEGGRTLVAEVIKVAQVDKSHRYEVSYQSFDNFSNRYLNRQVKIG